MLKNRLQTLLIQNRQTPRLYRIDNAAADEATVYLYDIIDEYWGISAGQFVKDLMAIKASTIHLRIHSPGGDALAGRAMATAIRAHKATVIAHVDGLAASAASSVALAADEVEIAQGAFIMIHRASSVAWGTADDFVALAALLQKVDGEIEADYVRETGNTAEAIRVWMDAETWFTADEAVNNGFADRVVEPAVKAQAQWNLDAFDRAPVASERPADPPEDPAPAPTEPDEQTAKHADASRRLATYSPQNREAYPA